MKKEENSDMKTIKIMVIIMCCVVTIGVGFYILKNTEFDTRSSMQKKTDAIIESSKKVEQEMKEVDELEKTKEALDKSK